MNPQSPAASGKNWPDNTMAITASGNFSSTPTTGDGNYQKKLNTYATRSATQGANGTGGSPSTTSGGHYQIAENALASRTAASGLEGGGRNFGSSKTLPR